MPDGVMMSVFATLIATATLAVASWTAKQLKGFRKEHTVLLESQRNQLKGSVVQIYENAKERNYITPMELDSLNRMADSYFELGGNHYIKSVVRHASEMELRGEAV